MGSSVRRVALLQDPERTTQRNTISIVSMEVTNTKIITINLTEPMVRAAQILIDLGLYPSRSEEIRVAIRDFLQRELGFAEKFEMPNELPKVHEVQIIDKKKEIARLLRKLREEQPELSTSTIA